MSSSVRPQFVLYFSVAMKAVRMKSCLNVVLDILYNLDVMSLAYVSWFIDFVKNYVKLRRT